MGKEKTSERRTAKILFVDQLKSAKEIAEIVDVQENTIGQWISKYGWRIERDTKVNSIKKQKEQINQVIAAIANRRIEIEKDIIECDPDEVQKIAALRSEAISKADEASKWNKTLMNLDKSNATSFETYLQVMDDIFSDLRDTYPKLYMSLLDFQENHIRKVQIKYQ